MSSWLPTWLGGAPAKIQPMKPTDAMHQPCIRERFSIFLDGTDPPATFKASEVAQEIRYSELVTLGYEKWEEAVPAVIELAFEMRALGFCELIKGGKVLPEDVSSWEIQGGVRVRRRDY